MKLDAKTVAALDLGDKNDAIYFDETMPGFGLRLRRSGDGKVRRSWVVQYKRANASRRVLLGSADVLGAEAAKAAARKVLGKVALGQDPQADKAERRARDGVLLSAMIDEYLAAKEAHVRPRTMEGLKGYLGGPYFRPLHRMPIDAVTRKDVAAQLVRISREHTPISAARARAVLSAFFVWAMQSGLVESNPVIGTAKPKDAQPRERVLSDAEIASIWRACDDTDYGRIVRLLILLGSRRAEIGGMCWSEIDPAGKWTLPAARSKNGRKHVLPLMPMALAIIKSVPQRVTRDQLFGEFGPKGFTAWGRGKRELDARSGVSDFVIHDVRRSVATRMADIGIAPHVIEEILHHLSGHRSGISGVYNRSRYGNDVRAALAMWEDHVRTLVDGGERKVVAFTPPIPT